jgi:A/G-specific adenine glycosylase
VENQNGEFYLEQRTNHKLLANMWTFPLFELDEQEFLAWKKRWEEQEEPTLFDFDQVAESEEFPFPADWPVVWQKRHLGEVTHIFSHLKWHILLFYGRNAGAFPVNENGRWISPEKFDSLVFPKPQVKLVDQLEKNQNYRNPF